MGIVSGVIVYILIWSVVLFIVLPWRAQPPKVIEGGHASAPEKLYWKQKLWIISLVSAVLWIAFYGFQQLDILSFR